MEDPALFISAGDPSGDNAASRLAYHLKEKIPNIQLFGLGGKKLAALGQKQYADPNRLAVMGFWEAIKNYFFFRKLFYNLLDEIKTKKPKAADSGCFSQRELLCRRSQGLFFFHSSIFSVWLKSCPLGAVSHELGQRDNDYGSY